MISDYISYYGKPRYDINSFSRSCIKGINEEDKDTQANICINNIIEDASNFEEYFPIFDGPCTGDVNLTCSPFKWKFKIVDKIKIDIQLNPLIGKVTIQIPAVAEPICLCINIINKKIFSNSEKSTTFEFLPFAPTFEVRCFKKENHQWQPKSLIFITSDRLEQLPTISKDRHLEINALAVNKNKSSEIMPKAKLWIDNGNYITENSGILTSSLEHPIYVQDLKVLALLAAGRHDLSNYQKESEVRIKEKKANLNCWQFCLLCYLEAEQISWQAVGKLYTFLDSVNGKGMRVPDAVKFGKFSALNFNDEHPLPKPGDFVCFSSNVGIDNHCAIFQNYDAPSDSFSFIEIDFSWINNKFIKSVIVRNHSRKDLDHYLVTFVNTEHVEENILNFLNYYNDL